MGSDFRLDHSADFDIMLEVRRKSNPMSIPVVHTCAASRVCLAAVVITLSLINVASAQTVWSGLTYTFTKAEGTDPQLGQNQDRITNNVWITRGLGGGLLNAATECDLTSGCTYTHHFSPQGTEWATALMPINSTKTITATNWQNLTFVNWEGAYNSQVGTYILNPAYRDAVVHLITDNIYLDLRFIEWTSRGGGGFSYQRAVVPVPETSSVVLLLVAVLVFFASGRAYCRN
jgi:hypothetical protein